MKQKFVNALSLALIVAMLFTSVALADNVENDIVVDPASVTLQKGGLSYDVEFYIQGTGGDGDAQCNFDSTSESLTFTIVPPSGVTATPSALTFNKCHDGSNKNAQKVSFSAGLSAVSGNVNFTQTANTSGGTFDYSNAFFYINISTPPNTAPTVGVAGVTDGASYNKGSVPAATCQVTDAEDGNSSFPATLSAITGPYASDGIGSQTASCAYTDQGGLPATPASATYSIVDPSAPVIGYTLVPASPDGSNGWYKSNVLLTWNVSDPESPNSLAKTGCVDQNITADQADTAYSCSATSAGGSTGPVTVNIKRDATAPSISAALDKSPDGVTGWFNIGTGAPTVSFTCSDATSGLASACPDAHLFGEGADQSHSETIFDLAGNSNSAGVSDVDVDLTAPVVTVLSDRAPDLNGWYNAPVTFNTSGSDATAGVLDTNCTADQTYSTPDGSGLTVSGSCTDNAGNVGNGTSPAFDFDDTDPSLAWVGGPAAGGVYYFGFVPAAPTCTASDDLSGPDGCSVDDYSSDVGLHTMTATAYDVAGNSYSEQRSYEVKKWTLNGFYQPVDMNNVLNTVKGGSTVPLKFEVFAGPTELTDTAVVSTLVKQVTCNGTAEDTIEVVATGGTSMRYDWTSGQFIFNWQTPKLPGKCYSVTLTTQDGSEITALFKLK